jgi:hypothetical protein
MDQIVPLNPTAQSFLASLERAAHISSPFDYWLLTDPLPDTVCDAIARLPVSVPEGLVFNGRRETNNTSRVHFSPGMIAEHNVCREVADAFRHPHVMSAIEDATGTCLDNARLRVEYCQDTDGFWLEPHVDIPVKLFTMLVYLSDDPKLYNAGTDIYDDSPEHRLVATAPYEFNSGLIFIPGKNTWHGFTKRPIDGVRKSIIINYVAPAWRATQELC